jgi:peptide/nickel transport system substrate-binding protein
VTLRHGARWHDGRPVATSDVAFTYEAILEPKNELDPLHRELGDLHMVELSASRPRTLRIRLHRPNVFVAGVLSEVPILPRHVWFSDKGKIDWSRHAAGRRPVGSGPYRLHEWKRGSRIVLRRAEGVAGAPPPGEGPPIEEIVYVAQPDGAAALAQLRRDELDVFSRVLPVHYPGEALTPLVQKRFREIRLKPSRYALLLVNVRRGPLGDARVRRAIAAAIDRDALLADIRRGLGRRLAFPELDGVLAAAVADPGGASRWLDEAGVRRTAPDAPRWFGGRPWRVELLSAARAPIAEEQTRRIAADLGKIGVNVAPRFIEPADLFGRLRKGTFDAAVVTYATRPHGDLSPLLATGAAVNHGGFSDAGVDAALEQVRRMGPGPERASAWRALGRLVEDRQPLIILYAVEEAALVRRTLDGVGAAGDWLDLTRARFAATPGGDSAEKAAAR